MTDSGAADTRYSRVEYERRFLVDPGSEWSRSVEPYTKTFEDTYIRHTRLRLRVLRDSDTARQVIKLTQKLASPSPYFHTIGRLLLSPREHALFAALEGDHLRKTRHYHRYEGRVFSIDVFAGELEGLVLCEVEADSLAELMAIAPPPYARPEVTEDPFFTGGSLCRTSRSELLTKLATIA
jgi:CYTH domain-containing protein